VSEVEQAVEPAQVNRGGRPRANGDFKPLTTRIPLQTWRELKRIMSVNVTTQETEVNAALQRHFAATKADPGYQQRLKEMLED